MRSAEWLASNVCSGSASRRCLFVLMLAVCWAEARLRLKVVASWIFDTGLRRKSGDQYVSLHSTHQASIETQESDTTFPILDIVHMLFP
jgi:hypothetical protein